MTREGKWTIGILLVVLAIVLMIPENEPPKEETSAKLTKSAEEKLTKLKKEKSKKEVTIERPVNGHVPIKGLEIAKENIEIRNPFTYQHETRGEKIEPIRQSADKNKQPIPEKAIETRNVKTTPQQKSGLQWELNGIIISEKSKQAVLSKGDKVVTLNPGDLFDGNKVVDITKSELIYEGQNGRSSLKLPGP
ncbi:MAG: hypothetical protein IKN43_11730 [Selenomonadaceae bacterium]|nr:hypothetical protein [Selenomonadaceae bacterium]